MRAILHVLHDLWCAITTRCAIKPPHDPYVAWMAEQEQESIRRRNERQRQRQKNIVEAEYLPRRGRGS